MAAKITNTMMGMEVRFDRDATIGRDAGNTIVLPRDEVSTTHAKIAWDEKAGCYVIEDLGSTNGTSLDMTPLKRPTRLGRMNVIRIARSIDLVFVQLPDGPAEQPGTQPEPEAPPAIPPLPSESRTGDRGTTPDAEFVGVPPDLPVQPAPAPAGAGTSPEGAVVALPRSFAPYAPSPVPPTAPETAQADPQSPDLVPTQRLPLLRPLSIEVVTSPPVRFRLAPGRNVVGRGESAEIRISAIDVSRAHAAVTVEPTRVVLVDLNSSYGTYYDGRRVIDEIEVRPGAVIRFGSVEARIVEEG